MGTSFNVQVETFFDARPGYHDGVWQGLTRWELQKDYAFARAFYEVAKDGWPHDFDPIIGEEDTHPEEFSGKRHADGILVAALDPVDDVAWFPWARQLILYLKHLIEIEDRRTRVLWWEE